MKSRAVVYWICTVLVAFVFLSGGLAGALRLADSQAGMAQLGYPPYFGLILGVWKVLGGLAILAPALPLLKEWAYAGMMFDLTGASATHIATHGTWWHVLAPLLIAGLLVASWALRPPSRRLPGV